MDMERDFGVVAASLDVPVIGLSGGNQQKVGAGPQFRTGAKAILIDEPTQGVDAGARHEIYRAVRENIRDDAHLHHQLLRRAGTRWHLRPRARLLARADRAGSCPATM